MKSQELFQINKRINQIKRNLQIRQQKAQQWSMPYQRILNKSNNISQRDNSVIIKRKHIKSKHSQNDYIDSYFSSSDQIQDGNKDALKNNIQLIKKTMQSRKKIMKYHNQLKQLQDLKERKTKLHAIIKEQEINAKKIQKQEEKIQQIKNQKFRSTTNHARKALSIHRTQSKVILSDMNNTIDVSAHKKYREPSMNRSSTKINQMSRTFTSSASLLHQNSNVNNINVGMTNLSLKNSSQQKNAVRSMKDRINPFNGFKVQKIIQIYQQAKQRALIQTIKEKSIQSNSPTSSYEVMNTSMGLNLNNNVSTSGNLKEIQNCINLNSLLGVGISNTPYNSFSKKMMAMNTNCSKKIRKSIERQSLMKIQSLEKFAQLSQTQKLNDDILEQRDQNLRISPDNTEQSNISKQNGLLKINFDSNLNSQTNTPALSKKSSSIFRCKRNLPQKLAEKMIQKENIYKNNPKKQRNIFQNRMKKILHVHGQFWKDDQSFKNTNII